MPSSLMILRTSWRCELLGVQSGPGNPAPSFHFGVQRLSRCYHLVWGESLGFGRGCAAGCAIHFGTFCALSRTTVNPSNFNVLKTGSDSPIEGLVPHTRSAIARLASRDGISSRVWAEVRCSRVLTRRTLILETDGPRT